MTICFTIDDVIRAKTAQIGNVYRKYIDNSVDMHALYEKDADFCEILFDGDEKEYKKFLYEDYPFEIFAEAKTTTSAVDKKFILWHMRLVEDEDIDAEINVMLANPNEFNASIGNTCFFLSKIATRVRDFYFPLDSNSIWDKCDVLVTSDKNLLLNKPQDKISVKIEMPYNDNVDSDISYSCLEELIEDDLFRLALEKYDNGENIFATISEMKNAKNKLIENNLNTVHEETKTNVKS